MYPLQQHFPYFDLYRKQVVKQADLVLAMQLRPEEFSSEQKSRNFGYYEGLTVRDSSLSASSQAVLAAEVGHLDLSHDYLAEAALMDLEDLEHNASDGLHIAALAGSWMALVAGFGGLRTHHGKLSFAPRLPEALATLAFAVRWRGRLVRAEVTAESASYALGSGEPASIRHYDETVTLASGQPRTLPIPPIQALPRPAQPAGREPAKRQARMTQDDRRAG